MTIIRAKYLTTFSVAPDGKSVAIGVADEEGRSAALTLPAECLKSLIMTLPDMMRRALRLQHDDPSLLAARLSGCELGNRAQHAARTAHCHASHLRRFSRVLRHYHDGLA